MKKVLFVIANYDNEKQQIFDEKISPRNQEYADLHGFDYTVSKGGDVFRGNPTWWKFTLIRDMIESGELQPGDKLTHLDADMFIVKPENDYVTDKSFSYAIDNGNTHCMGSYSITVNDWSVDMINRILDEDMYNKMKNDSHWIGFREQACWYTLCGIVPHSWEPFLEMDDNGWHSNITENTWYGVPELEEHVEIRGPEWNTTLLEDDAEDPVTQQLMKYNITKSKKEDTIIRHWAGGQPWAPEKWM
tara:strand:- start:8143 stop:8880 length:738 start_codon:yes stop_codon:yes gene_type:complete